MRILARLLLRPSLFQEATFCRPTPVTPSPVLVHPLAVLTNFKSHWMEDRPEKVEFLQGKGEENLAWIMRKYRLQEPVQEVDTSIAEADRSPGDAAADAPTTEAPPGRSGIVLQEAQENTGKDDSVWSPGR